MVTDSVIERPTSGRQGEPRATGLVTHEAAVIVIDDEPSVRDMLATWLGMQGFAVVLANGGEEAVAAVRCRKFDLALVDYQMPGMNGAQTIDAVKQLDPDLEAITVTGQVTMETLADCLRHGAFDVLPKPFDFPEMKARIQRGLAKSHLNGVVSTYQATRVLMGVRDLGELSGLVFELATRLLRPHAVTLAIDPRDGQGPATRLSHDLDDASLECAARLGDRAKELGTPLQLPSAAHPDLTSALTEAGFASAILFPLLAGDGAFGTLGLYRRAGASTFTAADLRRGLVLVSEVATVLDNARLYGELMAKLSELVRAKNQLVQQEKLAIAGQLAAGVAHEINTPIQFVGDSVHFLRDAFADIGLVLATHCALHDTPAEGAESALGEAAREADERADIAYLREQVPKAIERTLEGVARVAEIVRAMKEFAHPDRKEKSPADLNRGILSTLTVASNELKYVADVTTELADLPPVLCHLGDLNQVFLNLLVNAAHAIGDVTRDTGAKGQITVRTRVDGDSVVISIGDTGGGIPLAIRDRVFEPFYTTKEVGKGTGQGLAIARAVVVERHGGSLTFDSEIGQGTTFHVRLPISGGGEPDQPEAV